MADKEDAAAAVAAPAAAPEEKSPLLASDDQSSVVGDKVAPEKPKTADSSQSRSDGSPLPPKGIPSGAAGTFYKLFMNPQLDKLERDLHAKTAFLDELSKQWEDERKARQYEEMTKHVPSELKGEGQSLETIFKKVQLYFDYENYADGLEVDKLTPAVLTDVTSKEIELSMLSHALAAYVATLEAAHAQNLSAHVCSDAAMWLSKIFRYKDADSLAYLHDDEYDGLIKIGRLALQLKYPDYVEKGYEAFLAKPPVIYVSAIAPREVGELLCSQLGLPASSLCVVPCYNKPGHLHKMDVVALTQLVKEHEASLRSPLLLLAYAGTPLIGQVDDIFKIKELCKEHSIWLHICGDHLATLALFSVPTSVQPARAGDSITLMLGNWLGLAAIPHVTLFSSPDSTCMQLAGLVLPQKAVGRRLTNLPLWIALQQLGIDGITARIKQSCNLAKIMFDKLAKLPGIHVLNKKAPKKEVSGGGLGAVIGKVLSSILIYEIVTPTVVFRYGGDEKSKELLKDHAVAPYALEQLTAAEQRKKAALERYYDALNVWFAEVMKREVPSVQIETVTVDGEGVAVKFTPLRTAQFAKTSEEDIEEFCSVAERQISIMDATMRHRDSFQAVVEAQDILVLVDLPQWAGLGAIRYIPIEWHGRPESLTEIDEINKLNTELIRRLKANDAAFSLGRTDDGLVCARFGLITEDTDMEELIGLVCTTGQAIEEESKYVEKLAEVVRKGIEEAEKEIGRAHEQKLIQEGVLRQVPFVGSLINWFSPPPKEAVKGRALNLSSGRVSSTEETYKLHMQIQEEPLQLLRNPSVDSERGGNLKAVLKLPKGRGGGGASPAPLPDDASPMLLEQTSGRSTPSSLSEQGAGNHVVNGGSPATDHPKP